MKFENMIDELWQEVKEEIDYNKRYRKEEDFAREKAEASDDINAWYCEYMDGKNFPREPRKSIIRANLKMIRRLSIKYEKELKGE